jgi:hypothetical protein
MTFLILLKCLNIYKYEKYDTLVKRDFGFKT